MACDCVGAEVEWQSLGCSEIRRAMRLLHCNFRTCGCCVVLVPSLGCNNWQVLVFVHPWLGHVLLLLACMPYWSTLVLTRGAGPNGTYDALSCRLGIVVTPGLQGNGFCRFRPGTDSVLRRGPSWLAGDVG